MRKQIGRLAGLIALALVGGCSSGGVAIVSCSLLPQPMVAPIKPSKKDVLTEGTAKQIEKKNIATEEFCGDES